MIKRLWFQYVAVFMLGLAIGGFFGGFLGSSMMYWKYYDSTYTVYNATKDCRGALYDCAVLLKDYRER